jgi:hypothetical protein
VSAPAQFPPLQAVEPAAGEALTAACVEAATRLASKSGAASNAAEAKDFAAAVLSLSQALAIQNPETDVNGVPLEHELEKTRISKPEPAEAAKKKRVTSRRGKDGTTVHEVSES